MITCERARSSSPNNTGGSASTLLARVREFAMPYGSPQCQQVFLRQRGEMRMGPAKPWLPFTAEQTLSAVGLDFRWQARSRMFRWLPATIVDAFEGYGSLSVHLLDLFPIARFHGAAADKGEAMRAIAEMPWRPFGFVLRPELTWELTETGRLRASYRSGRVHPSVTFDIESDGRVIGASAPDRPRVFGKTVVETPWSGLFEDWKFFEELRVPTWAEANWRLPEGPFTYWRGQITEFRLIKA